ncbi:MAG TPA: type I restriction endonuclease subunit R, partial [Turneriella sp.]|nr:type I restriction endonuclease subunit R [Turneriella sp.]
LKGRQARGAVDFDTVETQIVCDEAGRIEKIVPPDELRAFRGAYLETAQRLRAEQKKSGDEVVQQLDFEFVLFASAIIDYDFIMGLIARFTHEKTEKHKMTRTELIGLIASDAKFIDEREDIEAYIDTLKVGQSRTEQEIRQGYQKFKEEKFNQGLAALATAHSIDLTALTTFVQAIRDRMVFDAQALSDLFAPLELGWKARAQKELAFMEDFIPLLKKLAQGREISGLGAYE